MSSSSKRVHIAVLFGGRSAEHDVSIMSAANVMQALDLSRYDPSPIYVTRDGRWLLSNFIDGELETPFSGTEFCLIPGGQGRILEIDVRGNATPGKRIDIVFPVLHGLHGEDGAVQGACSVARVPLVGCGILGSATALDKQIAKQLFRAAGLPVARSVTVHERQPPTLQSLENELGLPMFIKPARQGSSVGVRKISGSQEFASALSEAFEHDSKLIAEEFIQGREVEFSVLEDDNGRLFVSRPGEITPAESHGFYSYNAKYVDEEGAALKVPADLPPKIEAAMRDMASRAFRALGCDGMARVDFFLLEDMTFLINEVNTIPGFTDISMYSKAMAASGVSYPEVIDRLVAHGLTRGA